MSGSAMVLTDRDRRIVESVADFELLTREQLARHHRFGSVTRVNAVLLRLVRHGYLRTRHQPSVAGSRRLTYLLGPAGAVVLAGSAATARDRWSHASDLFAEHRLLVNDCRLAFEHAGKPGFELVRWLSEATLRAMPLGLVPDGYGEYAVDGKRFGVFLEADNGTESSARWAGKAQAYCELAAGGRTADLLGRQFFRVLVVAPSPRRADNIRREILRRTDRIFWLATRADLLAHGPLAPIWRRPADARTQPLIAL